MSDTLVTSEPQDKVSEDQTSSDPQSSKTKVPLTSVSMSTQAKAKSVLQPKRGTNIAKANLVVGSLIYSRGKSKRQYKPKPFSKGSIDFRPSGHFEKRNKIQRTNHKGPIRIWVPKSEIMYTAGMPTLILGDNQDK
jgi:hypothetical protein